MGKNLPMLLNEAKYNGVMLGLLTMAQVAVVGDDNILPDYIGEDKMAEVLSRQEKERQRIWAELREKYSPEDATDILVGHAFQIRKKWGISE